MKIVQITPYMHPAAGGPPVVVDRLSRALVARGHDVDVLTTDQYAGEDRDWAQSECRPYSMSVFPTRQTSRYAYSRDLSDAVRMAVRDCDIVHVHTLWTHASLTAMRACRRARIPYLVMPHGMLDPYSLQRSWLKKQVYGRMLEWPLLRRAARMCYTHPEEQRLAEKSCPRLAPGCIVELGSDPPPEVPWGDLREEFLQAHPDLRDRLVVLFLGRIHPKKGLDLLIPAFADVARQLPDARLLLVGPGDADYVSSVRQNIGTGELESRVVLTGPLYGRDKWAAMAASHLFVLPSYQENFALAAVDALRSGLPLLLSRRVNLWDDLVRAGVGRDCDLTVDSVARQMVNCLTDQEWREKAAIAGRALLQSRFNWTTSAIHLEEVYATAVESRSRQHTS